MTLYNVKLNDDHNAKSEQHENGYLYDPWTQRRAAYTRGEAIKKAALFGGKIEAVKETCEGLKTVFCDKPLQVTVKQHKNKSFTVIYGLQVKTGLDYTQAAHELGACLFHALACESKLDNSAKV